MVDRMDSPRPQSTNVAVMAGAIRARRKVLRLTQIELSRLAGCGPDFVYDVELGKPSLRLDKLLDLLAVLGLSLVLEEGKEALRVSSVLAPTSPSASATMKTKTEGKETKTKTKGKSRRSRRSRS